MYSGRGSQHNRQNQGICHNLAILAVNCRFAPVKIVPGYAFATPQHIVLQGTFPAPPVSLLLAQGMAQGIIASKVNDIATYST